MKGVKKKLLLTGLVLKAWQQSYNRNQQDYKRMRLKAIKLVYGLQLPYWAKNYIA
jgi:hypothetical protein